jgi:hypothetical protein
VVTQRVNQDFSYVGYREYEDGEWAYSHRLAALPRLANKTNQWEVLLPSNPYINGVMVGWPAYCLATCHTTVSWSVDFQSWRWRWYGGSHMDYMALYPWRRQHSEDTGWPYWVETVKRRFLFTILSGNSKYEIPCCPYGYREEMVNRRVLLSMLRGNGKQKFPVSHTERKR